MSSLLAQLAPSRGAPIQDVVFASIVGLLVFGGVVLAGVLYVRGRLPVLDRVSDRLERAFGLPGWAAVAFAVAGPSLLAAVFGFYWDVSWHIDRGRDPGPFANPAHWFIFIGLVGIAIAGALSVLLGSRSPSPSSVRLGGRWRAPVGGVLLLLSGGIALAGFPLDDVWHRLFGQDVTLWGPTHIQMVAGASLATLALLVLEVEARRTSGFGDRRPAVARIRALVGGATFLVGLSTLQAEFDFGVPQFRLLYQPVLIMLAAGAGLVAVRMKGGRGAALGAVLGFFALRGALTVVIAGGLGRSLLHFPLYLPEALLVELVALRIPRERPVRFAITAGAAIGTIGLAAEWGWSHLFMPLPWRASLLPEAAVLGFAAAIAGSLIGAVIGRALSDDPVRVARIPVVAVVAAWVVALFCIGYPLPTTAHPETRATVTLQEVRPFPDKLVTATVRVHPADAAQDADWFTVTAWQGAQGTDGGLVISDLIPTGPGVYRTEEPVPVGGQWKTLIRLQAGNAIEVVPIFMPLDQAIPAPLVPAYPHFTRHFELDKKALQREVVGGSDALQRGAYAAIGLLIALWLVGFAWGLRKLRLTRDFAPSEVVSDPERPLVDA